MRSLVGLAFAFALAGCHSTSLNDAINQECVDANEGRSAETFDDADVEALRYHSPNFQVAGHFNWIVFETGEHGDGCACALEAFELPEDK